jgi:hypothetical protein
MDWLRVLPQLYPLLPDIEKAVATAQRVQNDPAIKQLLATVQRLQADPDIKQALATAAKVAAILEQANA